jgi:hypothetical protein
MSVTCLHWGEPAAGGSWMEEKKCQATGKRWEVDKESNTEAFAALSFSRPLAFGKSFFYVPHQQKNAPVYFYLSALQI